VKSVPVVQHRGVQWAIAAKVIAAALLMLALAGFTPTARTAATPASVGSSHTVLVMGDSLSAAHGLAESQGWVALIGERIAASKPGWRVVNASISGETSADGAARVAHELDLNHPSIVVIELGANDALRGLPLQPMRANLARMIAAAQAAHAKVLLIGMRIPPNYGPAYTHDFEQSYRDLASQFKVALLPFLLDPIMLDRDAFQEDNLHPVASAEPKLRDHVWVALEPLLK
jgi:acyl-CoA thioesterase I